MDIENGDVLSKIYQDSGKIEFKIVTRTFYIPSSLPKVISVPNGKKIYLT